MRTWLLLLLAAAILVASCDAGLGRRKDKHQKSGKGRKGVSKTNENAAEIRKHCKMLGGDGIMPAAADRSAAVKEETRNDVAEVQNDGVLTTRKPTKGRRRGRKGKKLKGARGASRRTKGKKRTEKRKSSRRSKGTKKKSSRWG